MRYDNMKTYDVGMICFDSNNYGNNIVNYALYCYLKDMGFKTLKISHKINPYVQSLFVNSLYDAKDVNYEENLYNTNYICDFFLVGGDQQFRYGILNRTNKLALLQFTKGSKYKVSYGTSFGKDEFGERDSKEIAVIYEHAKDAFKKFNAISVREKSGVKLLKEEFDVDAVQVLDPVFLCDIKHYDELIQIGKDYLPEQKFIGAYVLDKESDKEWVINSLAGKYTNNSAHTIYDAQKYIENDVKKIPSVEEWLATIKHGEYVVTDSFHGVCFSIIFKKQFVVVYKENSRGMTRIKEILNLFGLESRLINEYTDENLEKIVSQEIDYSKVDNILKIEKQRCEKWLKEAIDNRKNFQCNDSENEYLKSQIYELKEIINNQQKMINELANDKFLKDLGETKERFEIVGFGMGGCYKRLKKQLREYVNISYVCDNDSTKWNKIYDGVKCISPEQLTNIENVGVLILVDNKAVAKKIAEQLNSMGIKKYKYVFDWSYYFI